MPLTNPDNINVFILALAMLKDVLLGLFGGLVAYLFDFIKARREGTDFVFKISSMLINMFLGAFVAYLIGTVVPDTMIARDMVVGMSGVTSYQILMLAESKFALWIFDKITKGK